MSDQKMSYLLLFFETTGRELNSMVEWKGDSPSTEFWELFNLAYQEAKELLSSYSVETGKESLSLFDPNKDIK